MIDTKKLIKRTRRKLGEPIMAVELEDEQMACLLEDAQETFYLYANLADMSIEAQDNVEYQWISNYFSALCKETLGRVRGKFSGELSIPNSELKLNYESLLEEAESEKAFLKYIIFKDSAILKQVNKDSGILVFYIGTKNLDNQHVEEYVHKVKDSIKPPKGFTAYYIPVREGDSRIECIYPDTSNSNEGKEVIAKLNDYLQEITENKLDKDEE
jgi:hypothetical protein